jgi:hypothetical protein
LIEEAPFQ